MVRCYMMTDRQGWTDTSRERKEKKKDCLSTETVFLCRTKVEQLFTWHGEQ